MPGAQRVGGDPLGGRVGRASALAEHVEIASPEIASLATPLRRLVVVLATAAPELQRAAQKKLRLLNAASELNSLRVPPRNRLEKLVGDRAGQHSIRISD